MKNLIKKITIVTTLTLLLPLQTLAAGGDTAIEASLSGQESTFTIMPVIGGNSMNIKGVSSENSQLSNGSAKSGSMIGVLGGYKLAFLNSTLETGVLYVEAGSRYGNWLLSIDTKLSYVSIPLNWRIPLFASGSTKFHGKVGLMPSYLVGAEVQGQGLVASEAADVKDSFNKFDVIAQAGLGGSYPIYDQFSIHADIAYLRGLREVSKDGGGNNEGLSLALALAISI